MKLKNAILGTSALVGVAMLGTAAAVPAAAQEVKPGGALDITITGFARFEAGGGEQDTLNRDNSYARGLDFRNDTEVHVLARGKSEQTGLEYGGTIEFEADTNSTLNTDESWVFLRGGWGEVRMGDEDGAVDNSIIGSDDRGRHGRHRRLELRRCRDRRRGRVPDRDRRLDQDPLLHAELRRVPSWHQLHADRRESRQRRQ